MASDRSCDLQWPHPANRGLVHGCFLPRGHRGDHICKCGATVPDSAVTFGEAS